MSFHHIGFSESPFLEWGTDTMKPPPLTISALLKGIVDEMRLCVLARVEIGTTLVFLFLIIVQRVAYSIGWHEGGGPDRNNYDQN